MATVVRVSLDELGAKLEEDLKAQATAAKKILQDTTHQKMPMYLQEEIARARPRPPVDRGEYRRGWKVESIEDGVTVYNPLVYAGVIEKGRRKGRRQPPGRVLAQWVLRKGITRDPKLASSIAFLIGRKMKRIGWPFPPNSPMGILEKATKRLVITVKDRLNELLSK